MPTVAGRVELDLLALADGSQTSALIDRQFAMATCEILAACGAMEYQTA